MESKPINKEYEVVDCECGHAAPLEFAKMDDDANWTCANCIIEEQNTRIDRMFKKIRELIKIKKHL